MAREILLLQSQDLSLRFSTSSVQSVQAHLENPQETAWPQASASASSVSARSVCGQAHTQNSRSTLWPYPSRVELAVSSIPAPVHIATSGIALAKRPLGFALGRALFPLSRERLGVVCDGAQAVPPKSSRLPLSFLVEGSGQRESRQVGQIEVERLVAVPDESAVLHHDFRDLDDRTSQVGLAMDSVQQALGRPLGFAPEPFPGACSRRSTPGPGNSTTPEW